MSYKRLSLLALLAIAASLVMASSAMAAFPNLTDCPIASLTPGSTCIDDQSLSGEMIIKGFHVPLDHSLEIRGGVKFPTSTFIPPAGTNGFFATPVQIPGGLLGIELPIGLNMVTATAELAGTIVVHPGELEIRLPLKLHLSNPLIGPNCYIGSNTSPITVDLITGTTNPPLPNRPISGAFGTPSIIPPDILAFTGNINVDNSFSIPGASGCGLGLGLINAAIDLKLGLPSTSGNNTLTITSNAAARNIH